MAMRGCVWTLRGARSGRTWTLGINSGARPGSTEVTQIQFIDFVVVEAELEYIIMRQSTEKLLDFVCSFGCSRSSHLDKGDYSPAPCIWQPFLGVWVLLVEYGTLDFSGDDFVRCAMLGLTVDTGLVTVWLLEEFHIFATSTWARILALFLLQHGEVCSVDASI